VPSALKEHVFKGTYGSHSGEQKTDVFRSFFLSGMTADLLPPILASLTVFPVTPW
jgi:hypothetical protein